MSDKIYFIADVFADQIQGGGELNNEEAIRLLRQRGLTVEKKIAVKVTEDFLKENKNSRFIIGNFMGLSEYCKRYLTENLKYTIYEHDHKYLITRDPSGYPNYTAPLDHIVNRDFYKNALGVFCQSKLHTEVLQRNLKIDNLHNLGGNLWSESIIDSLVSLNKKKKTNRYSIWFSENPIKNTEETLRYCKIKKIPYDLVGNLPYKQFLERLTDNSTFIFLPKTLETLCRVIVEARIAGMKVITNKNVGAASEDWFKLKGPDLAERMILKREEITDKIIEVLS